MKTLLLLALTLFASAGAGHAATLSGIVYNAGTSMAAANQKVFVLDSLTNYFDSTLTNASGSYSFQLAGRVDSNDVLLVYTTGCGKRSQGFYQYHGGNIIANLYICPALYSLNGTVSLGGGSNNGPARLFLLSRHYDTLRMDTVLSIVDTIYTDATGSYSKNYSVIPGGTLLLKAELLPTHPQYGKYLPTWFDSALVWSNAQPLSANNFSVYTATGVSLVPAANPGGNASASGMVTTAGRNGNSGTPLQGRLLLLTNAAGAAIAFTESDSLGIFSFGNLAYGTYKLFGDAWGKLNPALTFTLTAAHPDMDDIIFEEDSSSFSGRLANSTGVGKAGAWAQVRMFPNPAGSEVFLTGLDAIGSDKQVLLRNMAGALLQRQEVHTSTLRLNLTGLPEGIYMVEIRAASGVEAFRLQKR